MPDAQEIFLLKIKGFLQYIRPLVIRVDSSQDKVSQLRRISDIRIRELKVRKPKLSATDLCRAVTPGGKKIRFDETSLRGGLFTIKQLQQTFDPLEEHMSLFREAAILSEVFPPDAMLKFVKNYVQKEKEQEEQTTWDKKEAGRHAALQQQVGIPEKIAHQLAQVRDLWSIPELTKKLQELLNDPETKIEKVSGEMEKDPALAMQVLRIVNSAYTGINKKIGSTQRAITLLGFQNTKRIVMMASIISKLGKEHSDFEFDIKHFWGHSLWVGHAAALLGEELNTGKIDEHFTAGLLHDIGKLITYQYLRAYMKRILATSRGGTRYDLAEKEIMGTDHAEIGANVCEKWGFMEFINQSVKHHLKSWERIQKLDLEPQARVVIAVCNMGVRSTGEQLEQWCEWLGIARDKYADIRSQATDLSMKSIRDLFVFSG